jgi:hypothetical protein
LRSIIKEEIESLNEGRNNSYDFKKISGGFSGDVYTDFGMFGKKTLTVNVGLYSGGSEEGFEIPFNRKEKFTGDAEEQSDQQYKLSQKINNDIGKIMVKNLKKFESTTNSEIEKYLNKLK